jgi:hypothetical protein
MQLHSSGVAIPCPGVLMRRTQQGWGVVRLHYSADPTMQGERLEKERKRYTSEAWWRKEMEIDYDALSGQRVYPEFDSAIHVIQPERIPRRGCRYFAIDPHHRTPHAMLWVLIDAWNDWYVYREFWPSKSYGEPVTVTDYDVENNYTVKDYAESITIFEGNKLEFRKEHTERESARYIREPQGEHIIRRYMDQAGKAFTASGEDDARESYAARYIRYGIHCADPYKIHRAGMDAVRQLLTSRKHEVYGQWPRLHVSSECRETVLEFTKYRYKTTKFHPERELKQEGIDARCHLLDCLRYLSVAGLRYNRAMES